MEAPVVTACDGGLPKVEDEIQNENTESTPSAARQEVNKQTDEFIDSDKIECGNDNYGDKTDANSTSPRKLIKRNISFPVDPVSGYLDPPDPWKNVPNWKTEDLLKAYKLCCEKHATKPLNKIVQQLTCIDNVGERYEILSLKGERLDIKQCESLEDIFRHVRFRCLDLEATHLDDETAEAIFSMVEYYESACKLNISFNKNIGPRGWQSCSKLIRKTPCLTFIDAKNCDLNERVMPILGRSLRMGCYLTRLHLQSVGLAGRALVILVAALKMNEILKELFIGDNKLMSTDGVQIGNLLKFNHKLELLDLRNNHLQDVGVHHVCDGLTEQISGSGLLTLVLWNNQISFQAMSDISQALIKTESLETLNLGHNPITNEGIHLVKDGLLKSKSLLKLGLSGTKISCEGAVALAEVIADTSRLVRLDLQENDIKTAGLMALSLALKVNKSLSRLDVDKDTKKEQGIKDYAEQQRRLQQDIKTYLERNRDLAHKQLKEKEAVTKVEEKVIHEDQNKAKTDGNLLESFEVKGNNGENELTNEEKDLMNDESVYIPVEDKINRPKLLFLPEKSPESDLESPACVPENINLLNPLEQPQSISLTLPTSSGQDLLSPQYLPKMTAKKLFSVTRVTSPTLAPTSNPLLDTQNQSLPITHICTPLSSVPVSNPLVSSLTIETLNLDSSSQVEVDACLIQHKLECETLSSYIQEIVDTDTVSSELNTQKNETEHVVKLIQIGLDEESDSVFEETIETFTTELCRETVTEMSRLSAGDGPIKADNVRETNADNCNAADLATGLHGADNFNLCDKNYCASDSVREDAENPVYSSELVNASSEFENEDTEVSLGLGEGDKLTSDKNSESETDLLSENANIIPSGSLLQESRLKTNSKEKQETVCMSGSESHCVPKSLASKPSDDQLDSIEIIPESDINEIKFDSEVNEELPELLDCDSNDDITNNAYLGLTDSLCDLVLPFELENNDATGDLNVNNTEEKETLSESVKPLNEVNIDPLNSKTNGHQSDSGILENDSEQWNKVEKSDFCDNVKDQELDPNITRTTNRPDFHTSLSLNGLKQELASLIDEDGNVVKGGTQTVTKSAVSPEDISPVLVTEGKADIVTKTDEGEFNANGR